jgi:perosamine synthetase
MTQIPITKPYFTSEAYEAIQKPLETGWVVQGPFVQEFEQKFSLYTGSPHSVATSNCTTALHISVAALGLKPGDEVIVPAFTWISTANVVEYMGARPVFCDIELSSFNLDVSRIEELITPRTVGIIPVHLFGLCADMDPLMELAGKYGLWVVEDAACAFGAWYKGRHAGTIGTTGCFSFHPRKSITTGEGGMLTTRSDSHATLARTLRDHGASRTDLDRHTGRSGFLLAEYEHLGYNYRMTDIQGALGTTQMDVASWILESRRTRAAWYDEALESFDFLATPVTPEGSIHGYQGYVCLFRPEEPTLENVERLSERRNRIMSALEAEGIATRQGTHAPVAQVFYRERYGLVPEQYPVSWMADRLSLALPLYPQMTEDEQQKVVAALRTAYDSLSR